MIVGIIAPRARRSLAALIGLMVVGTVLETLGIGLIVPAIGLLTQPSFVAEHPRARPLYHWLGDPSQTSLITYGMLGLVAVFLVKTLFLSFVAWRQNKLTFGIQAEVSQRLFSIYLRQPYPFHLRRNSAELVRNTINEVWQFNGIVAALTNLTSEILVVAAVATLLLFVEPVGATIVVVVLGLAGWGFHSGTRERISLWGVERQQHEGMRFRHLQQGLGGAKEIKLLGREEHLLERYTIDNLGSARVGERQTTLLQLPRLFLDLLAVVGLASLVLTMVMRGRDVALIAPTLGLFAVAAFRLLPSANRVLGAIQTLRYGVPVVEMLKEETALALPPPRPHDTHQPVFHNRVNAESVTFTYPGAPHPALRDVSVEVRKGEAIGFIGPSGSGKSTLVDLFLGLLEPTEGTVSVDGTDVRDDLRGWQNQVGYVPQAIFLTDDTLRRNVAFGLPEKEIDDSAVQRAVAAAQLDEFVASLPDGLETVVGERGVRLSGGQRQRIGIARSLYHNPSVLVLDEATSALDSVTEAHVMDAVMALPGDMTIFIVAHRLSTLERCNRIYRLLGGRIADVAEPSVVLANRR